MADGIRPEQTEQNPDWLPPMRGIELFIRPAWLKSYGGERIPNISKIPLKGRISKSYAIFLSSVLKKRK
jgi:hypothetical protein